MSARMRLCGVLLGLLLPTLLVARWSFVVLAAEPRETEIALPRQLRVWVADHDQELDAWSLAKAAPDTYLLRRYQREGAVSVELYVGLYARSSGLGRAPHSPQGCYPAAGWEILGRGRVDVLAGEGKGFRASLLEVQKGNREQLVLYWFQPPGRWPSEGVAEQFLSARDSVRGQPQFAFVRLAAPGMEAGDLESLLGFAGVVAPEIRGAVERMVSPPSERGRPASAGDRSVDEESG
jgi:EpsI family protein